MVVVVVVLLRLFFAVVWSLVLPVVWRREREREKGKVKRGAIAQRREEFFGLRIDP
jgi:hypothetical protein